MSDKHPAEDLFEQAWNIICNTSGGDWDKQSPVWQSAAQRLREDYFKILQPANAPVVKKTVWQFIRSLLPATKHDLKEMEKMLMDLKQTLTDATASLTASAAHLDKIATESAANVVAVADLTQKVADLNAQIAAGGVTPEIQTAADALTAQVAVVAQKAQAVDDLVPDAPVAP